MEYNGYRPHSSLGDLTPKEFIEKEKDRAINGLPAAPTTDPMNFANIEHDPTASEKSPGQSQANKRSKRPDFKVFSATK